MNKRVGVKMIVGTALLVTAFVTTLSPAIAPTYAEGQPSKQLSETVQPTQQETSTPTPSSEGNPMRPPLGWNPDKSKSEDRRSVDKQVLVDGCAETPNKRIQSAEECLPGAVAYMEGVHPEVWTMELRYAQPQDIVNPNNEVILGDGSIVHRASGLQEIKGPFDSLFNQAYGFREGWKTRATIK